MVLKHDRAPRSLVIEQEENSKQDSNKQRARERERERASESMTQSRSESMRHMLFSCKSDWNNQI